MAKKAIPFVDPETGIQIKPGIYLNKILQMTYLRSQLNIKISTVKSYTGCPKKHGNSVTNWISSLL